MANIIESAADKVNKVEFYPLYGKEELLNKGPKKAINILRNRPSSGVFLVPDLYPRNKPFTHSSYKEIKDEISKKFIKEIEKKKCVNQLRDRFFIHCFKYDLESLLLASEDILLKRLGKSSFSQS